MRVKPHKYTEEELQFFRDYAQEHIYTEIQEEFIKKFGWNINKNQIHATLKKLNLKTGCSGFVRYNATRNKGKKLSKETYKKCEKTMFKKGRIASNRKPIGSERNSQGYTLVKVANPDVWRGKHRVMYEQYHNIKLNKEDIIIFIDNNVTNFNKDNLVLVNRSILSDINKRLNFNTDDVEIRKAVIALAKARYELKMKKQELRKE